MQKRLKIAFGGNMGTGKDIAVEYLIKKYSGQQISFAQPIYDILHYAQKICGFNKEKDRKFLQWVGTEWAREKKENIWICLALEKSSGTTNSFISDLRFPNEFISLKKDDWICIKLIRNVDDERKGTGSHQHISETSLNDIPNQYWDYIIENNGSLHELYEKLDAIINE